MLFNILFLTDRVIGAFGRTHGARTFFLFLLLSFGFLLHRHRFLVTYALIFQLPLLQCEVLPIILEYDLGDLSSCY